MVHPDIENDLIYTDELLRDRLLRFFGQQEDIKFELLPSDFRFELLERSREVIPLTLEEIDTRVKDLVASPDAYLKERAKEGSFVDVKKRLRRRLLRQGLTGDTLQTQLQTEYKVEFFDRLLGYRLANQSSWTQSNGFGLNAQTAADAIILGTRAIRAFSPHKPG